MKLLKIVIGLALVLHTTACFRVKDHLSNSKPIQHDLFDSLLRQHVSADGWVNYEGFIRDSQLLNTYLETLSKNHPNDKNWSRNAQLAYWINAYNAFTIKLICQYYPLESIKDIKKGIPFVSDTWAINFISIEGKTYNLNDIEHGIIRPKFEDPRIHFAINCASKSCPKLRATAFTEANLEATLEAAARDFINDGVRNKIYSADKAELSKIFSWFSGDFKKKSGSVVAFINQYATQKLTPEADISYLDYDWGLNKQ